MPCGRCCSVLFVWLMFRPIPMTMDVVEEPWYVVSRSSPPIFLLLSIMSLGHLRYVFSPMFRRFLQRQ